jgi:hypothetical protein
MDYVSFDSKKYKKLQSPTVVHAMYYYLHRSSITPFRVLAEDVELTSSN